LYSASDMKRSYALGIVALNAWTLVDLADIALELKPLEVQFTSIHCHPKCNWMRVSYTYLISC
jgi:hypothetical protein